MCGYDFDGVVSEGMAPTLGSSVIITGRSWNESPQVLSHLHRKGILVPVYFQPISAKDKTLESSALWKAAMIIRLGVDTFFEDDIRQKRIIDETLNDHRHSGWRFCDVVLVSLKAPTVS